MDDLRESRDLEPKRFATNSPITRTSMRQTLTGLASSHGFDFAVPYRHQAARGQDEYSSDLAAYKVGC